MSLLESEPRQAFYDAYEYDVRPPTDDHPFFGHYFKWAQTPQILAEFGQAWLPFGGGGYLVILALLLLAVLLASLLILLPVIAWKRARRKAQPNLTPRSCCAACSILDCWASPSCSSKSPSCSASSCTWAARLTR